MENELKAWLWCGQSLCCVEVLALKYSFSQGGVPDSKQTFHDLEKGRTDPAA